MGIEIASSVCGVQQPGYELLHRQTGGVTGCSRNVLCLRMSRQLHPVQASWFLWGRVRGQSPPLFDRSLVQWNAIYWAPLLYCRLQRALR